LSMSREGMSPSLEMTGYLPPAPELANQVQHHWLQNYRSIGAPYRIRPQGILYDGSVTLLSDRIKQCKKSADELSHQLMTWLNAEQFRPLDRRLREELNRDEEIRVLIRTDDKDLQKLPWHLWDLIEHYPNAEVALSPTKIDSRELLSPATGKAKVRILAILGHSEGINIDADRRLLETLPNAETVFLVEPKHKEINDRLWEQPWDIIFFAGHSETEGETGRIYINPTESLTIHELWYALRKAVEQGLQFAIFNSCDGLGLARQLNDLQIPQIIVMRELVPDRVAQEFLKYFLTAFASSQSFYQAARGARERLQGLEKDFPCATWLPVIYQNLPEVPPTWKDLLKPLEPLPIPIPPPKILTRSWWRGVQTVLLASVVVTSLVTGVRSIGILEPLELKAFDQLMRVRPDEGPDKRLLLVTITENDVQSQPLKERGAASLSDRSLDRLLKKLEQYQPNAIGLDIYRENPVRAEYRDLKARMQKNEAKSASFASRFISICQYGSPGVLPPPEVSPDRQGFNNVLLDPDDILRRHLLAVGKASPCQSQYSFNFQLATRYLADRGIELKTTHDEYLQLGTTVFKTLEKDTGGYNNLDARGHQLILNYRASNQIAETVTLSEILSDRVNPNLVKDRIVLIGTTASSFHDDRWRTPYSESRWPIRTTTGIEIQAHMLSQILSAVLDGRPLIWCWSKLGEAIWIGFWAFVGGMVAWRSTSLPRLVGLGGVALGVLYGSCLGLLIWQGCWVPLIPSALVLVVSGGSVVVYTLFQSKQQQIDK
ncbi:MAG TPA: CHASE2 domain-containing protein, partial [Chroococcales cyanobacterium]